MKIPNNPQQAYLMGKRHGTQENMDLVAMALTDKCGFHVREETEDCRDTKSVAYLYEQLEYYAAEINAGRIKRKDIKKMLAEEQSLAFED